jgi:hypothetical protein
MMRAAAMVVLAAIVLAIALTAALAITLPARGAEITLPPDERARCQAEGGCALMTAAWLRAQLQEAFSSGFSAGKESVRCARPPT